MLNAGQIATFHRDGFLIVPGAFSAPEVQALAQAGSDHAGGNHGVTDLYAIPALADLWTDRRLVTSATQLLGEKPTFYFEGSYSRQVWEPGVHARGRHIHHDAKGTPQNLFSRVHSATATYPNVRFAIYMQDTSGQSGGLKVSPGSHLIDSSSFDHRGLPYVNVATMPGDLVCFFSRTLHSPYALRPRHDPALAVSPWDEDQIFAKDPTAFLPSPRVREAIFMDFARPDLWSDLLIKNRVLNLDARKKGLADALIGSDVEAKAEGAGVDLRMDAALIDAAMTLSEGSENGRLKDTAMPLFMALPYLCRQSAGWSPHFNLFDTLPADGDVAGIGKLLNTVLQNINAFQTMKPSRLPDLHMGGLKLAKLYS